MAILQKIWKETYKQKEITSFQSQFFLRVGKMWGKPRDEKTSID